MTKNGRFWGGLKAKMNSHVVAGKGARAPSFSLDPLAESGKLGG